MTQAVSAKEQMAWAPRAGFLRRWEQALADRLNPLLVKEARQGLKSRQFAFTFFLALVSAWVWSLWGLAASEFYEMTVNQEVGREMLMGYLVILGVPLLIVLPLAAFRSMVGEHEDGTYELVSITGLTPGQVVRGKLASVLLQGLIYFSVFVPCVAFTYLLGGVSLLQIAVLLVVGGSVSIGLISVGLAMAVQSSSRHFQMFVFVGLVMLCMFVYLLCMILASEHLWWGASDASNPEFWSAVAWVVCLIGCYSLLMYSVTRAQLIPRGHNRSTAVRVVMLICGAGWVGGTAWVVQLTKGEYAAEVWQLFQLALFAHWFVACFFILGEQTEVTRRIRLQAPRSLLGKALAIWLQPGPTLGFFFTLFGCAVQMLVALLVLLQADALRRTDEVIAYVAALTSYVAFYGGMGLLAMRLLRRWVVPSVVVSLVVALGVFTLFLGMPLMYELLVYSVPFQQFRWYHVFNPVVTLDEIDSPTGGTWDILIVLTPVAVAAAGIHLPALWREIRALRHTIHSTATAWPDSPSELGSDQTQPSHPFEHLKSPAD